MKRKLLKHLKDLTLQKGSVETVNNEVYSNAKSLLDRYRKAFQELAKK